MRVVFAGTPEFAAVSLRALLDAGATLAGVLTQPDRPAGRGRRLTPGAVKRVAMERGLVLQQPATLRDAAARAAVAALQPDLLVVAAYGLILPSSILELPPLGCVNVHASLLPRWRGAAPIQRAIEAGDGETGVCLMRMDTGLDTGAVLASRRLAIGAHETAAGLHDRLAALGADLLTDSLPALAAGALVATPQPSEGVTYAERLRKEEAWIDWSRPADELERRVRAFNPWPVACTGLDGRRLRVWLASASAESAGAPPGTVVVADRDRLEIATGEGRLALERLQLPGGKPLAVRDFRNALRVVPGMRLEALADARS